MKQSSKSFENEDAKNSGFMYIGSISSLQFEHNTAWSQN